MAFRKLKNIRIKTPKILSKKKNQIRSKVGKAPGTLVYLGERDLEEISIVATEYDPEYYNRSTLSSIDELNSLIQNKPPERKLWINICGIPVNEIEQIGKSLNIHPLTLEDILNTYQRPKIEYYEDYIYSVSKFLSLENSKILKEEQVNIILKDNLVISIQELKSDLFEMVYERIRLGSNIFRKAKCDYLFYVLNDIIIDHYFIITEEFSDYIDDLQERLLDSPHSDDLSEIRRLKKEVQKARQLIIPMRENMNSLLRRESGFITETSVPYLRDASDHMIQIYENTDVLRDSIMTLLDIYLSSISNKMNQVMKVLTIIATIFIPLTFIAGIYGMNFTNMPELQWEYGYFAVLIVMLVIGIAFGLFFKRKHWF